MIRFSQKLNFCAYHGRNGVPVLVQPNRASSLSKTNFPYIREYAQIINQELTKSTKKWNAVPIISLSFPRRSFGVIRITSKAPKVASSENIKILIQRFQQNFRGDKEENFRHAIVLETGLSNTQVKTWFRQFRWKGVDLKALEVGDVFEREPVPDYPKGPLWVRHPKGRTIYPRNKDRYNSIFARNTRLNKYLAPIKRAEAIKKRKDREDRHQKILLYEDEDQEKEKEENEKKKEENEKKEPEKSAKDNILNKKIEK